MKIVPHYESDPNYIKALANSLRSVLRKITFKPDIIITSYHGIPEKYFLKLETRIIVIVIKRQDYLKKNEN